MVTTRRFARPCVRHSICLPRNGRLSCNGQSGCKSRRIACSPGSTGSHPCHRCEIRNCHCDAQEGHQVQEQRDENELAEIRAELKRLDTMLQVLTGHSPSSSESSSPSTSCASDVVEINDLIGAMTNLCFSTEGLTGPISDRRDFALVREAGDLLAHDKTDQLANEGFVYTLGDNKETLEELIALLPPWSETATLLMRYATSWFSQNDSLFTPMWYTRVEKLFASDFATLESPCEIAELAGVLAVTKSGLAVEQGAFPKASKFASGEAERYAGVIRRALELGDYMEKPTIYSVRALHLISTLHLLWATSTTHFSCGFAIIPAALAMALQLGLNQENSGTAESPMQCYERKALITGLVRNDWTYPPSYGRPSSVTPSMIHVGPPDYLEDDDLPPEYRQSPWRAHRITVQGMQARYAFARLHREMTIELFASSKTCDYVAVKHYAERIAQLEDEHLTREFAIHEDAISGALSWVIPSSEVTPLVAAARLYAIPKVSKCAMALHRPFFGYQRGRSDQGVVDEEWHKREMIKWARRSFMTIPEGQKYSGPFVSMSCSIFDTLIGLCLIVRQYPDDPYIERYRAELSFCVRAIAHPEAPPAVAKLVRITTHLLDRPRLRQDEADNQPHCKRQRAVLHIDKPGQKQGVPALSPDAVSPHSFEFSAPVTPVLSAHTGDELHHKRYCSHFDVDEISDFDRLTPFFHSRTMTKLNKASSGLDILSQVAAEVR